MEKTAHELLTELCWRESPQRLEALGIRKPQARSLVGKWLKSALPEDILRAVDKARRNGTPDPAAYVTAALTREGPKWKRDNQKAAEDFLNA